MRAKPPSTGRFLTALDVAAELAVSVQKAREIMRTMPHIQTGRVLRVSREAFDAHLRALEVQPPAETPAATAAAGPRKRGARGPDVRKAATPPAASTEIPLVYPRTKRRAEKG